MWLSYDSIQVVFLDLLALQESTRIVNQFLLSPYLSHVCVNEPFTLLDGEFLFPVEYLLARSMFWRFKFGFLLHVSCIRCHTDGADNQGLKHAIAATTGRNWSWCFFTPTVFHSQGCPFAKLILGRVWVQENLSYQEMSKSAIVQIATKLFLSTSWHGLYVLCCIKSSLLA